MINKGSDTPISKVNEIIEVLEPVALQVIEQIESNNVLNEVFEKEQVKTGAEVEYLLIQGANVESYDKTGKTTLAPRNLKKAVQYFNEYEHKVFVNTIYESELEDIALTETKAKEIAGTIINQIAVERDDYDYEKEKSILAEIKDEYSGLEIGTITGDTIAEKCKNLTIMLRNTIDAFLFKNDKFLAYNIENSTNIIKTKARFDRIRILMPYTLRNVIDVEFLASVYNLDKAELLSKIVTIDTEDSVIYVIDKKSTFKYPKYNQLIIEQLNAEGNFRNVFLHQKAMFGFCGLYKFAWVDCSSIVNPEPPVPPVEDCALSVELNVTEFDASLYDSDNNLVSSVGLDNNIIYYNVGVGTYRFEVTKAGYQSLTDYIVITSEDLGTSKNVVETMYVEPSSKNVNIILTNEYLEFTCEVTDSNSNVVSPVLQDENITSYELTEGTYSYSVSATGYTTATGTISVVSADYGQTEDISVTLIEE